MSCHFQEQAKALWSQSRLATAKLLGFSERDYAFAIRLDAEQTHIRRKMELQAIETRIREAIQKWTP